MDVHPLSSSLDGLVYWSVSQDGDLAMSIREIRHESSEEVGVRFALWALRVPPSTSPKVISFITLRDASVLFTVSQNNDYAGGKGSSTDGTPRIILDQICFQYDFRVGLLGNRLLHFDYREKRMIIAEIRVIDGMDDHLPPIQWLEFIGDRVLLIGSQDVCRQDTLESRSSGSGRVLAHRGAGHLRALTAADYPLVCCSLCLQSAPASKCHACEECSSEYDKDFIVCSSCLQQGAWCSDQSHNLRAAMELDKAIRWRPSHVFLEVSMEAQDGEEDATARPRFQERLGSVVNHLPTTHASTKSLFWLLDEAHILIYSLETDQTRVLPLERDNLTYSPTDACLAVGTSTLYKLYDIANVDVFTCYVGKRLAGHDSAETEWLFWMTVYQCTDIETTESLSSTFTYSHKLDKVRADSIPTVMVLEERACVTYINEQGQLQVVGLDFISPTLDVSRRGKGRDERLQAVEDGVNSLWEDADQQNTAASNRSQDAHAQNKVQDDELVNSEFAAVTLADEEDDNSTERPSGPRTLLRRQEDIVYIDGQGQSERLVSLDRRHVLEKIYALPPLDMNGSIRVILVDGGSEGLDDYFVIVSDTDHPQTVPMKLAITENVAWNQNFENGVLDQVTKGVSKLHTAWMLGHPQETDLDSGVQSGIRPHTLCEACVSVIDNLKHAETLPIWTGDTHPKYEMGQDKTARGLRDIRHRFPEWAVIETGISFHSEAAVSGPADDKVLTSTNQEARTDDSYHTQAAESTGESTTLDDEHFMHHHSLQSMAQSILRGCHLCTHFRSQMDYDTRCKLDEWMRNLAADELHTISTKPEGFVGYPRYDVSERPKSPIQPQKLVMEKGARWHRLADGEEQLTMRISRQPDDLGAPSVLLSLYQASRDDEPRWKAEVTVRKLSEASIELSHEERAKVPSTDHIKGRKASAMQEDDQEPSDGPRTESQQQRVMRPPATRFTSSAESMLLAGGWLSQCLRSHNCLFPPAQTRPPTRVIDICPDGFSSSTSNRARLHTRTSEVGEGMPYVALSHCWGAVTPKLQLTRSTLETLCEGFDLDDLPATFRDAANICQAFNMRYLWIDSLCIIQDDRDDWQREAATMASVYGNAIFTIAARASTSTQTGCFAARNRLKVENLAWQDKQGHTFIIQGDNSDVHQWDTRGWIYQERLLSARVLSFSADGLSWDCNHMSADEKDYDGHSQESEWATVSKSKELMSELVKLASGPLPSSGGRSSFLSAWYDIAENYSRLRLSHDKDRMIAIAGIAAKVAEATGYHYYYGLWHSIRDPHMLLSQLLWMAQYPVSETLRDPSRDESCPPSFSWLAAAEAKPQYCISFHDRKGNVGSLHHTTIRSTFMSMATKKNGDTGGSSTETTAYIELLNRNGSVWFSKDIPYEGRPVDIFSRTDVVFHCTLQELVTPDTFTSGGDDDDDDDVRAVFTPKIILTGPVRDLHIKARDAPYEYEYPWGEEEEGGDRENQGDNGRCYEWFFPDTLVYPTKVKCLTVATWRRSWDGRWYAAGLVLGSCPGVPGEGEGQVRSTMRVGYFEHSWAQQVHDLYDYGSVETIALV